MILLNTVDIKGFNERRLTENDLTGICEDDRIRILAEHVGTSFYLSVMGCRLIVIPERLRGIAREFALWHEIGHHLMHGGRQAGPDAFFLGLLETRNEAEADAFAAVALVPRPALASYDWLEENPGPDALRIWQRRTRLLETYGI